MADRKELKTVKRGRPKKENCANNVCRVCETNLWVKYGSSTAKSFVNLFKPSLRDESFGVVWAERLRNVAGITVIDSVRCSQLACNVCFRKIKNLCELLEFISKRLGSEQQTADRENDAKNCDVLEEGTKRKFLAVLSPTSKSSPPNKSSRIRSPGKEGQNTWVRKSLGFDNSTKQGEFSKAMHSHLLSRCNVDDLDTSQGSAAIKVVICYPNGDVSVKNKFDRESQNIIRNISLGKWKTVANASFRHELLASELRETFSQEIARECKNYSKADSCLQYNSPDQLAVFSNKTLCKEVELHCPLLYAALCKASNLTSLASEDENERAVNAVALAFSCLIRCRNPSMSAVAYRISTILFHSGVSFKDFGRLNHLGVCMSHKSMIALQQRMGENFEHKAIIWRRSIECNKSAKLLLEEVKRKQIPEREEDDMDLELDVDVSEANVECYDWYSPENYQRTIEHLEKTRQLFKESTFTVDVLDLTLRQLENERLPFFK